MDNPCVTLSNVGSYTNWSAEYNNSRCVRTVNNSYSGQRKLIWQNQYGFKEEWGACGVSYCTNQSGVQVGEGGTGSFGGYPVWCVFHYYTCLYGGSLSGSTCVKIDTEYRAFSSF